MITRLTTLPTWLQHTTLALLIASLLLMGGCTGEDVKDVTYSTGASVVAGLILCGLFHACGF